MRDKDMRKLFDTAAGGFNSSDITPEEIKEIVDNRISYGKTINGIEVTDSDGETVEATIVRGGKSMFGLLPKSLAGAAAFAVTAAVMGIGLNLGREEMAPLSTDADISLGSAIISEITTASEETTPDLDSTIMSSVLENGTEVEFWLNGHISFAWDVDKIKFYSLLLREEDRLIMYPENLPWEDITDKISKRQCYIVGGNHRDGIVQYIITGGDVSTGDYGYAIVFRPEDSNTWGIIAYAANAVPIPGLTAYYCTPDEVDMEATWLANGLEQLMTVWGETDIEFPEGRYFLIKNVDLFW